MQSISVPPPIGPRIQKIKKYNLLISIYGSKTQAGAALTTDVFGPYDSFEECKEAGIEAKREFAGYHNTALYFTCVPIYEKYRVQEKIPMSGLQSRYWQNWRTLFR